MERIEQVNDAVHLYVNNAWFPARAALAPNADANAQADVSGSPVLTDRLGPASWQGPVPERAPPEPATAVLRGQNWQHPNWPVSCFPERRGLRKLRLATAPCYSREQ